MESNEVIEDQILLAIPKNDYNGYKLELRVVSGQLEWWGQSIYLKEQETHG